MKLTMNITNQTVTPCDHTTVNLNFSSEMIISLATNLFSIKLIDSQPPNTVLSGENKRFFCCWSQVKRWGWFLFDQVNRFQEYRRYQYLRPVLLFNPDRSLLFRPGRYSRRSYSPIRHQFQCEFIHRECDAYHRCDLNYFRNQTPVQTSHTPATQNPHYITRRTRDDCTAGLGGDRGLSISGQT